MSSFFAALAFSDIQQARCLNLGALLKEQLSETIL